MTNPRSAMTAAGTVLGVLRAEAVFGVRLTIRHPVPRAAFGWAVGLAAITHVLGGPPPGGAIRPAVIAIAGLLAAAAGPRAFVRGGPFESFRWGALPPPLAAVGRLGGVILVACLGSMGVAFALGGSVALEPALLAGAAMHAAVIGALGAALAPAWGCTTATVLPVLLVAAGVAVPEVSVSTVLSLAVPLPPPGVLVTGVLDGQGVMTGVRLGVWGGLALLGIAGLGQRAARPVAARRPVA
jgi:hypothetical protein